jgi:hypothetical protein
MLHRQDARCADALMASGDHRRRMQVPLHHVSQTGHGEISAGRTREQHRQIIDLYL